jgi:hypothetical protein
MRLPFVSRAAFDLSQHNAQMLRELVKAHQDERYDKLLVMYHELALRVSSPATVSLARAFGQTEETPIVLNQVDTPARPKSVIAQAIAEESGGDSKLARWFWKRAGELKAENKTPEEIARALRQWQTSEVEE